MAPSDACGRDFGGYAVERVLGRGGSGTVYAARRVRDGLAVAVKVGARRHDPALMREGEALAAVGPPAVPELFDRGLDADGAPFIVTELLTWPTLAERLTNAAGPLPSAAIADAILAALAAVHARGFIHRDLKPENIFVGGEPVGAKLVDLGLSGRVDTGGHDGGTIAGTAYYMAPEQCVSGRRHDRRTDIYSFGVILYEMMTGRVPFVAASESELQQCHLTRRPPPPSSFAEVSRPLEEIVLRCLAKDPERRFADVATLRAALAAAMRAPAAVVPPSLREAAVVESGSPARQRRTIPLLFLRSQAAVGQLQIEVKALGGQLASVATPRYVVAFAVDQGEPPLRRALRAARSLVARGLCEHILVDTAAVSIQPRPDGSARFVTSLFRSERHFAFAGCPPGILISSAVADGLPELMPLPPPAGCDWLPLPADDVRPDATLLRDATAPMVGRDEILAALLDGATAWARAPGPSITTILAEAGHGKSRLCAVVAAELPSCAAGAQRLELRASEPMGGDADETLRALLRRLLALPADAAADDARGLLVDCVGAAAAAELWPLVGLMLGWIRSGDPRLAGLVSVPGVLRAARARAVGEILRARSRIEPLIVILDDAQFADQTTLDALEYATLADERAPIHVYVFARPTFAAARPFWGESAASHVAHRLGPLDDAAAKQLCRQLLKPVECVADEAVMRLVERTRGVPLLLVELVRGLKRDGVIKREARSGGWYLAADELDRLSSLPLVEWLAERELGRLPPALASSARLTSLLASDFGVAELDGILGELDRSGSAAAFPLDARVAVERLTATGVLVAHRTQQLSFRHAVVREAIAATVADAQRRAVHAAAYRYYLVSDLRIDLRIPRLAHHAAHSGMAEEAASLYLALAEAAHRRHAYVEAETLFTSALGQLAPSELRRRLGALGGRAQMRYRISRFGDALADLAQAQAAARQLGDDRALVELLLDEATVLDWMEDFPRSRVTLDQARAHASGLGDLIEARLLMGEGRSQWRACHWAAARDKLAAAAALAEREGDGGYETLLESLLMLGEILTYTGGPELAQSAYDRVIALSREHQDRVHWASALNNRRCVWVAQKNGDRAVDELLLCMQLARECGAMVLECYAQFNVAEILHLLGRADALPHIGRFIELAQRRLGEWARPAGPLLEARWRAYRGEEDEARALIAVIGAAQERARAADHPEALLVHSEAILLAAVELSLRDAGDSEWNELLERSARFSVEQERIEVVELRGLGALRRGKKREAARWLGEALAIARTIPNVMEARIQQTLTQL